MKTEIKEVDVPTERLVLTLDIEDASTIISDIINQRFDSWTLNELRQALAKWLERRKR